MKHFYLIVCAFLLSAAFTVVAADKPQCARKIEIGKNVGAVLEPNKVQIVLANKFKSTRFAAEELAELLGEALGSPIPIVETPQAGCTPIYLGLGAENSGLDAAKLSRDAFFIVVKDGAIRIAGEDDPKIDTRKEIQKGGAWGNWHERGTVFGVYEFLERFADCRFYLPGPMGTIIPKTDKITVPEAAIIDRPDWAGRRLNDVYSNTYYWGENVRKVKHPGKNLQQVRLRLSTQMPLPSMHGSSKLNLRERFSKTHPEYFALRPDGSRVIRLTGPYGDMLCFSGPVREVLYQDYAAMLRGDVSKRPGLEKSPMYGGSWRREWVDRGYVDVMPGDCFERCACADCRKAYLDQPDYASNLIWGLAAEIGNRLIRDGFTSAKVSMSAYYPYQAIPTVELPGNIEVGLCVTGPMDMNNPVKLKRDNDLLKAWSRKLGRPIMISNYADKKTGYRLDGVPNPAPRAYADYYKLVMPWINGVYMYYNDTDHYIFTQLADYVFSKIAWDNNTDVEKLFNEYYARMFGPAAPVMRRIMERYEDLWIKRIGGRTVESDIGPCLSIPSQTELWTQVYNDATMKAIEDDFDAAERAAKGIELERVKFFRREFHAPLSAARQAWLKNASLPEARKVFASAAPDCAIALSPWGKVDQPVATMVHCQVIDGNLIVKFHCSEPTPDKMVASRRKHDDPEIWKDNSLEIFLNPSGDLKTFYQLIVNSQGSLSDARINYVGSSSGNDWSFDSNARINVRTGADFWEMEAAIPLAAFGEKIAPSFPVNFCRTRNTDGKAALFSWCTGIKKFYDFENFGRLILADSPVQNYSFTLPMDRRYWSPNVKGGSRDEQVFFSAPASLKIESKAKRASAVQRVALKSNTRYHISYVMKTEDIKAGPQGGAVIKFQFAPGKQLWVPSPLISGTTDWTHYGTDFTTPAELDPNKVLMEVCIYDGTGKAWFDDVAIQELPQAE